MTGIKFGAVQLNNESFHRHFNAPFTSRPAFFISWDEIVKRQTVT